MFSNFSNISSKSSSSVFWSPSCLKASNSGLICILKIDMLHTKKIILFVHIPVINFKHCLVKYFN